MLSMSTAAPSCSSSCSHGSDFTLPCLSSCRANTLRRRCDSRIDGPRWRPDAPPPRGPPVRAASATRRAPAVATHRPRSANGKSALWRLRRASSGSLDAVARPPPRARGRPAAAAAASAARAMIGHGPRHRQPRAGRGSRAGRRCATRCRARGPVPPRHRRRRCCRRRAGVGRIRRSSTSGSGRATYAPVEQPRAQLRDRHGCRGVGGAARADGGKAACAASDDRNHATASAASPASAARPRSASSHRARAGATRPARRLRLPLLLPLPLPSPPRVRSRLGRRCAGTTLQASVGRR